MENPKKALSPPNGGRTEGKRPIAPSRDVIHSEAGSSRLTRLIVLISQKCYTFSSALWNVIPMADIQSAKDLDNYL